MNLATAHPTENEFGEVETNEVVIRSYTEIGSIQGFGKVEVEAREAIVPDRRQAAYFVKVTVESGDQFTRRESVLVQYSNLEKLITSIGKLETATIKTDRFAFTEIEYDVDGLKIIVFNERSGKLMFAVGTAGTSAQFRTLSQLDELKVIIGRAKRRLEENRIDF